MSIDYTAYDKNGRILKTGTVPDTATAEAQRVHVLVGTKANDVSEYITDPGTDLAARALRPQIPDLDTIPAGTDIYVDGTHYGVIVDEGTGTGSLTISGDVPGTYRIRLVPPFPYLPMEFDHVVEEPAPEPAP